jgi:hypothetical protein
MRSSGFIFFLLGLMALLDIYVFQVLQVVLPTSSKARLAIIIGYWVISLSAMLYVVTYPYINHDNWPHVQHCRQGNNPIAYNNGQPGL